MEKKNTKKQSKTKQKKVSKKTPKESTCFVLYVENSTPEYKVFDNEKSAKSFILNFQKKNPNPDDGWWVDWLITDIRGEIFPVGFPVDSVAMEEE